ncbi:MAG: hypothetical protein HFE75_08385 [Firmicutes bacterium]|nr:hypothetical protein [Bacillota bacterium]
MILIILGVSAFCGLLALIEVYRNGMFHTDCCYYNSKPTSRLIHLPADLEREKRRRNIL